MSVFDKMLDGRSLYDLAIETIRHYGAGRKSLVAFSGGKDSQAVLQLCIEAGIDFSAQYSVTRFEPPELLDFIRRNYPQVSMRRAYKKSLVREIEARGFPSRWVRWCCGCKHAKTAGFDLAFIGVRGEESPRRRETWRTFGRKQDGSLYCCPIFNWTAGEVWEFLEARGLPHCRMYDEGYSRIGCVLCPLVGNRAFRLAEAARYPRHVSMFRQAARRFAERMRAQGWKTARGRSCGSWKDAKDPAEEILRRWIETGQTMKSVAEYDSDFGRGGRPDVQGQCVFEGSGFSERDGMGEEWGEETR